MTFGKLSTPVFRLVPVRLCNCVFELSDDVRFLFSLMVFADLPKPALQSPTEEPPQKKINIERINGKLFVSNFCV
jgi:hypothetical protein